MSFHPFSSLPPSKPDPLFAIGTEAKLAGPSAINGTLGVVMDEEGKPLVFSSVKKALTDLAATLSTLDCSYPALTGLPAYREAVRSLLPSHPSVHFACMASTGGTGALAINLRLLRMLLGDIAQPSIILPTPAWGNHPPPCRAAGLVIAEAPYIVDGVADHRGILDVVARHKGPCGVLLQVGCHNPTGLDLTREQWITLADGIAERSCVALLDIAYQGFIGEPMEDTWPIQLFLERGIPTLVTWSASKNHSIYGLRTGAACAYVPSDTLVAVVEGHYSSITRMLHSAASTFGQAVVAHVQRTYRDAWLADLRTTRSFIDQKRARLTALLPPAFQRALRGHGMFAQLPLTVAQVHALKNEHRVFMTLDGRLNIAGIPERRIEELAEKIQKVL